MFWLLNYTGKLDKLNTEFSDPHPLIVTNCSVKLNLFPDTFSIIIQVENQDRDSEAC